VHARAVAANLSRLTGAMGPANGMASRVATGTNADAPPRGETVGRAQRQDRDPEQRLIQAMIEVVGTKGYRVATVSDVIALAGVSRKTFYEHFANKQDCFFAAFDLVSARVVDQLRRAYGEAVGWPQQVEASIRALFKSAVENPSATRFAMVEIGAVGPAGIARRERSTAEYERFIRDAAALAPDGRPVSGAAVKAIVGGVTRVLTHRVLRGEHRKLLAQVPELVRWAVSYYPTPEAILAQPEAAPPSQARTSGALTGGRAPGTLAPHPLLISRRGLPRGDHNVSRSFVVHSQRERILDAVANLTAQEGYAELKVERIAEEAAVSLNAFYEHFADKEDAFLVAYEVGHTKGLSMVERAYSAQPDWRWGIRSGISTLFEFLSTEPSFAHIALVDALTATQLTAERSTLGVSSLARMLVPGRAEAPGQGAPAAVTIEAIAGGIFELCLNDALGGRIADLPRLAPAATYIALAPFIGGEEAARVATATDAR
jgi:AcrR family transcriptional regulator